MCECIEHRFNRLIYCHINTVAVGAKRDRRVCRSFGDRRIAAEDIGRSLCIMRIRYHRMAAVVVDGEVFALGSLVDDAHRIFTAAAIEVGHTALFAVADVFVILVVARVVRFIRPSCTILEVKVRRRAVIDDTA